jgi:AraC-like DNA-binding protein
VGQGGAGGRPEAGVKPTFSEFVLDFRLAQALRPLRDPRMVDRTISSTAFSLGFGDLSYLNRKFRRRYGAAPSDIRPAPGTSAREARDFHVGTGPRPSPHRGNIDAKAYQITLKAFG